MKVLWLVLLLAMWDVALGADLGRLFTTPAERQALDLQRASTQQASAGEAHPKRAPEATPPSRRIRLDGIVRTSSGRHLAWVNGEPMARAETTENGWVLIDVQRGFARLRPAQGGTPIELKPGEEWASEISAGTVTE